MGHVYAVCESEVTIAVEAAAAAAAVLRRVGREVLSETGKDIKSQADLDAEAALLEVLRPRSPAYFWESD